MSLTAVTVIGHDRPGIIADVTDVLADLGLNLEDSTMTLLRGHFAMMLICAGSSSSADIEAALRPLTDDGTLLVTVRSVPEEASPEPVGRPYLLSVHGGNGSVVSSSRREKGREGCMSVPDLTGDVKRATRLVAAGSLPLSGERVEVATDAFEARALQHEIDHCAGYLFIHRVAGAHAIYSRKTYL